MTDAHAKVYENACQNVERVFGHADGNCHLCCDLRFPLPSGEIPGCEIDRTGAALIGAGLKSIAFGVVSLLPEAYLERLISTPFCCLLSMMILVAYLRLSGFFQLVSKVGLRSARTRTGLLLIAIVALVTWILFSISGQ